MEFNKTCKNPRCKKEFISKARNAAYCCPECQSKHYESRKKARKSYDATKENQRLVSASYKVAQRVADMFLPHNKCESCSSDIDDSKLEVHHKDLNPFNNTPSNLTKLCKKCHAQLHLTVPKVNMVTVLERCNTFNSDKRVGIFMKMVYRDKSVS